MPDSTSLPIAEGGAQRKPGGIPSWMLIAGAGVGIVVLVLAMSKGGTSGAPGTTAAGTSINAALGSIQEENLNLMGQMGQGFNVTQAQIGQGFGSTQDLINQGFTSTTSQLGGLSSQMLAGFTSLQGMNQAILDMENSMNGELAQINSGVIAGNALSAAEQQSLRQQINSVLASLQNVQQGMGSMEQGLGGSIGTDKGELLSLAYALGKGQQVQDYLRSRGDYTTVK